MSSIQSHNNTLLHINLNSLDRSELMIPLQTKPVTIVSKHSTTCCFSSSHSVWFVCLQSHRLTLPAWKVVNMVGHAVGIFLAGIQFFSHISQKQFSTQNHLNVCYKEEHLYPVLYFQHKEFVFPITCEPGKSNNNSSCPFQVSIDLGMVWRACVLWDAPDTTISTCKDHRESLELKSCTSFILEPGMITHFIISQAVSGVRFSEDLKSKSLN